MTHRHLLRQIHGVLSSDVIIGNYEIARWAGEPARPELIEIGVDGIITNDPSLAARYVDAVKDLTATQRMLLQFRRFWPTFKERQWWQKSPEA